MNRQSSVNIYKSNDERFMLIISSNAYRDREDEIVRQKALEDYVKDFKPGKPLLFWHGGEPIGEIIGAEMKGPFLLEVAKELPDADINLARDKKETPFIVSIREFWDVIEKYDGKWGASIGFKFEKGDEQDKVYDDILKFETSILPLEAAANAVTNAIMFKEKAT